MVIMGEQNNLQWVDCSQLSHAGVLRTMWCKELDDSSRNFTVVSDVWIISMVFIFCGPWNMKCLKISSLKKIFRKIAELRTSFCVGPEAFWNAVFLISEERWSLGRELWWFTFQRPFCVHFPYYNE